MHQHMVNISLSSFSETFREEAISCSDNKEEVHTTNAEESIPHHGVVPNLGEFLALKRVHRFFKIK